MGRVARQARLWRDDLLLDPELSSDWRNWERATRLICDRLERPQRPGSNPRAEMEQLRDAPLENLQGSSPPFLM
jgi:hypothetical protein